MRVRQILFYQQESQRYLKKNQRPVAPNQGEMSPSTYKSKFQDADEVTVSIPTGTSKIKDYNKLPETSPTDKSKVRDSKIIKDNIVFSFQWKTDMLRLKMLYHHKAWFLTGLRTLKQYLELTNDQSKQMKSLRPDFKIWDMDTTTGSDLLVTELLGHHIKRISTSGDIDTFADLSPYETWGIHVTKNEDVLVGLDLFGDGRRVTRLSSQGQTLQVIDKTTIDKDLGRPHRITENVNQDIVIICDWRYIIVVDRNGKFRFKYTGPKQIKMARVFRRVDTICNQNGHILVADSYNNTIHLLEIDGNFIQFILDHPQVLKQPMALAIDGTNRLLVGCNDGQVFLVDLF